MPKYWEACARVCVQEAWWCAGTMYEHIFFGFFFSSALLSAALLYSERNRALPSCTSGASPTQRLARVHTADRAEKEKRAAKIKKKLYRDGKKLLFVLVKVSRRHALLLLPLLRVSPPLHAGSFGGQTDSSSSFASIGPCIRVRAWLQSKR